MRKMRRLFTVGTVISFLLLINIATLVANTANNESVHEENRWVLFNGEQVYARVLVDNESDEIIDVIDEIPQ